MNGNISGISGGTPVTSGGASVNTGINGISGGIPTTSSVSMWDGGFIGISEEGVTGTLVPAIEKYCQEIEAEISTFNEKASMEEALKGPQLSEAVATYLSAIKKLLQAYVSRMRQGKEDAKEAYDKWHEGQQQSASMTSNAASDILSEAAKIKLD